MEGDPHPDLRVGAEFALSSGVTQIEVPQHYAKAGDTHHSIITLL